MATHPGHTVLQVPVPQLETFVRARTAHYDADYVSADPDYVHAHVTALGPFLPPEAIGGPERDSILEILRETEPFEFVLARVATFPNGIIHLVPEPEEPFRRLTARLARAFPQCPPYAGQFPDVRPHLTLDAVSDSVSDSVSEASTRRLLGELVPARCRAERLDLAWYEQGGCRVLASWPLGPQDGMVGPSRRDVVTPAARAVSVPVSDPRT
ncbi:hypothetical protein N865_12310 [Intrasporangium oryzae NRRL B-24470]|uniref:2'-5' RNA ligase n=1 Tax=Intrasporangium oryzae NRRL B-24470 TaxID=1386089 RepID=W9G4T5_9MICO|nr:2'-5' RNA ligase family protein [Intrasporangium oryzae]EWT00995.1 hypothetical protein N865_12310 [Intrasporangium oryzae NRRL B-24470]